jgi:hypothetical protein
LAVLLWSAECSCKAEKGHIRPGGWISGVLKIERERGKRARLGENRRELAAGRRF